MMRDRGFTFNGVHSSEFNIYCDPASRQLIPEKRRSLTVVPGRSGSFAQTDGAYNDRSESFTCYYTRQPGTDIARQAREIAAWLSENGVLRFDSEPDKYYKRHLNSNGACHRISDMLRWDVSEHGHTRSSPSKIKKMLYFS